MAELKKQAAVERLVRRRREPPPLVPEVDPAGVVHLHGESVAVLLQRARLGLELDVDQVAADLKIRKVYLVAIEDGRFDDLPGPTYAVGFVRAYADYLALDSEEIVQRFKEEVEGLDERLQLVFLTPSPESRVPGGALARRPSARFDSALRAARNCEPILCFIWRQNIQISRPGAIRAKIRGAPARHIVIVVSQITAL